MLLLFLLAGALYAGVGMPTLTSSQNPAPVGSPVTFTMNVTGANMTGQFALFDAGSTSLGQVPFVEVGGEFEASLTVSNLTAGEHPIRVQTTGTFFLRNLTQVITGGGSAPPAGPSFFFSLLPGTVAGTAAPGSQAIYNLSLQNTGDGRDSYHLTLEGDIPGTVTPETFGLAKGESAPITVTLNVPAGSRPGEVLRSAVRATSDTKPGTGTSSFLSTTVGDPNGRFQVTLPPGWSPLAVRTGDLTSLDVPPELSHVAFLNQGQYQVAPLTLETMRTAGAPSHAVWAFCQAPATLTYTGTVVSGDEVPLERGWNFVCFPNTEPLNASDLGARRGLTPVPLGSVVLPNAFGVEPANNSLLPVNLDDPTTQLPPGQAFWVFATVPCELVYPTAPAPDTPPLVVVGTGGGVSQVSTFNLEGQLAGSFLTFGGFTGGVRVASGDITGDGRADLICGAGPGGGPQVQVYDGLTGQLAQSFFAFDPGFTGGVFVGAADTDGNGRPEIVVGTGEGGEPRVRIFDDAGLRSDFLAFDPLFAGGVRVAGGDVDGDGRDEVIVGAGSGSGPQVKVFGAAGNQLSSFFAFDPSFGGGVYVAAGDLSGDGDDEIIVGAGSGGDPQVSVFSSGGERLSTFLAFQPSFRGGVRVGAGDLDGDGTDDLIVGAGPGGGPAVRVFRGLGQDVLSSFLAGPASFNGGIFVGGGP